MHNFPIFLPDADLRLNALRILAVVDSITDGKIKKIEIENLSLIVFLVKNPYLVKKLLLASKELRIFLRGYEEYSINAKVPSLTDLYKNQDTKKIIAALVGEKQLQFSVGDENEILIEISDEGRKSLKDSESDYISRIRSHAAHLKFLRGKSVSIIHAAINKVLKEQQ